ncbi:MAG: rhodanese-related sulfurtransferase [Bradymonadaceae bacterium]|nr:rhodanese-related sulfurtransferase [Lujinxingiaceae bacterium]
MTDTVVVAAMYKFAPLEELEALRGEIERLCLEQGVLGTLLMAPEGLNATLAGSRAGIDAVVGFLRAQPGLETLSPRESYAERAPFLRLKVRIKPEIVTFGVEGIDPLSEVGVYVDPAKWNELIERPEVLVIDTRNAYEVELGRFEGALDPQTENFRAFADYVDAHLDPSEHPEVAMYCTGGIRCEKATAFMLSRGFSQVYHLQGGILHYLERIEPAQSLWQGRCFVFDERRTVGEELHAGRADRADKPLGE